MRGFTLIEILLVTAIIVVLASLILPLGIDFYQTQQLDSATEGLIQALRRAQLKAMAQADNNFGVYVGSGQTGQYSLFKGNSYATKIDEEIFEVSNNLIFSGVSEVVFSKIEGRPTLSGEGEKIVITFETKSRSISISEGGRINLEL